MPFTCLLLYLFVYRLRCLLVKYTVALAQWQVNNNRAAYYKLQGQGKEIAGVVFNEDIPVFESKLEEDVIAVVVKVGPTKSIHVTTQEPSTVREIYTLMKMLGLGGNHERPLLIHIAPTSVHLSRVKSLCEDLISTLVAIFYLATPIFPLCSSNRETVSGRDSLLKVG